MLGLNNNLGIKHTMLDNDSPNLEDKAGWFRVNVKKKWTEGDSDSAKEAWP